MFCYLGLFTWNARTGYLDTIAERTGLEIVGYVLSPVVWIKDQCVDYWNRYLALVDVAEENERLRDELRLNRMQAILTEEDRAELGRLRKLLRLESLYERPAFAARIIARRFGPQGARSTFTVNKGFLDGAVTGTPVMTEDGVVGRILRAAPHASTVLMLTDPGFRLAVISQTSRTPGILTGSSSAGRKLEVAYVSRTARIMPGEMLVTAGVDGVFPKGIPVGHVTSVTPGNEILFQQVHAEPLADLERLEEVLLLHPEGSGPPLLERLPDPVEQLLPPPPEGGLPAAPGQGAALPPSSAARPEPLPSSQAPQRQNRQSPPRQSERTELRQPAAPQNAPFIPPGAGRQ